METRILKCYRMNHFVDLFEKKKKKKKI